MTVKWTKPCKNCDRNTQDCCTYGITKLGRCTHKWARIIDGICQNCKRPTP